MCLKKWHPSKNIAYSVFWNTFLHVLKKGFKEEGFGDVRKKRIKKKKVTNWEKPRKPKTLIGTEIWQNPQKLFCSAKVPPQKVDKLRTLQGAQLTTL